MRTNTACRDRLCNLDHDVSVQLTSYWLFLVHPIFWAQYEYWQVNYHLVQTSITTLQTWPKVVNLYDDVYCCLVSASIEGRSEWFDREDYVTYRIS